MEEKVFRFDFFKEYYNALKLLPATSVGKISLAIMSKLFDDTETVVGELTAEEEAICVLLESLIDLHDDYSNMFN